MKTLLCTILLSVLLPLRASSAAEPSLIGENISGKFLFIAAADQHGADPGAPTKLSLDIVPPKFYLEWKLSPQDPGTVTGYEIVRSKDYRGPYHKIATVNKGIRHYEDSSIRPQVIYFYKVRAIAGDSYSPYSNAAVGDLPPH
ncbi:MAG TPA: hypothetical protein DCP92_22280 [Nitrospiraceae bacterium]|nr:hypothetical protein [Nitrospiraceae bacterium]